MPDYVSRSTPCPPWAFSATRRLGRLSLAAALLLAAAPAARAQTWDLVWSDEFNGTSVNTANWSFEVGGGGWGNNELEYYTSGANAAVSGGLLTITARRESGGFNCWYGPCQYTSTRMNTRGKREFTYGRMEARMALPMGQGLWPAFWALGANIGSVGWPASGEIDIMEHINRETLTYGTIHWDSGGHASYGGSRSVPDPTAFHVYAIEWTPASIKWFVDGVQYVEANIQNSINSTEEFHRPFFALLNLAVGGNWPGSPDGATAFPARLQVDYVRVYQQSAGGGTISPTAWYTVQNVNSTLCADQANGSMANGTPVQQWPCQNGLNQQWRFRPTDSGYYNVVPRTVTNMSWDVTGGAGATGNGVKVQLWSFGGNGGTNQQWRPESLGNGRWRFRARHSGRCLDVPGASTTAGVQLQQWDCNGTGAQSFVLAPQP
jgi:beta-glucanase (GH16 family)